MGLTSNMSGMQLSTMYIKIFSIFVCWAHVPMIGAFDSIVGLPPFRNISIITEMIEGEFAEFEPQLVSHFQTMSKSMYPNKHIIITI